MVLSEVCRDSCRDLYTSTCSTRLEVVFAGRGTGAGGN